MRGSRFGVLAIAAAFAAALSACNGSTPAAGAGSSAAIPSAPSPQPIPAAAGPTGSYLLTMTASPTCDRVHDAYTGQLLPMPDVVRVRHYTAKFVDGTATLTAADGTGNTVLLGGIDQYAYPGRRLMTLTDNELTIVVPPDDGGGYITTSPTCAGGDYWWEDFDKTAGRNQVFESCGTWKGSIQDSGRIEGTIAGSFGYYVGTGPNWATDLFCKATDHHFELVKQ